MKFLSNRRLTVNGTSREIEITGTDTGPFAKKLQADGYRIVDAEQLREIPDGSFDVISCIEVIEHLVEPACLLPEISRLLRRGGLLLLTTGNMRSPAGKILGFRHPYCVPEVHISLFNPELLKSLYSSAGLQPYQVSYYDTVRYKVLKTVRPILGESLFARAVSRAWPVTKLFDFAFGVSQMPCAIKT